MPLIPLLLFLFAWVGHGYLLMLSLNLAFSQPYNRKALKVMRNSWGLLLVAGPPLFALLVEWDVVKLGRTAVADGSYLVPAAYA